MDNVKVKIPRRRLIKRLWQYLRPFKGLIITAGVLTVVSNALSLLGPLLSGYAIDAVEPGKGHVDFPSVFKYALLMVIFYVVSAAMSYLLSVLLARISRNACYEMREDIFKKLANMPIGFFDRHKAGDVISIISYDVDTVKASLSTDLIQICTSVIMVVGSIAMMLSICPELLLIFCVTTPALVLFTRYRVKRVKPLFKKRSKKLGEMNGYIEEIAGGHRTIKAYHSEQYRTDCFDEKNHAAVEAEFTAEYYGSMFGPITNFINNLSLAFISMFGAVLLLLGRVSLGNISSFILYSRKFSGPINEFANILNDLQSTFAAAERIFTLIDETPQTPDAPGAVCLENVRGDVRLENVCFGYEPDKRIIDDFSLKVTPGSLIAIVGSTGAGKTTLINLLMRFYDIDSGKILVDSTDIYSAQRRCVRDAYSMVLQDTWLFYGTVFENIAYGKPDVTIEQVVEAAKSAGIHTAIAALPEGYDTVLSDNAANLSKGQKQLITIARAMLQSSQMIILDEATSNVDTQTERKIMTAMNRLMSGKTCFVIAHRLSTVENANSIVVVEDGKIVEQGTHEQLLKNGGAYHKLYYSQFDLSQSS